MSKKSNTVIFLAAASVFNILVTVVLFLALYLSVFALIPAARSSESIGPLALFASVLAAFAGSFFLYRGILGLIRRKVDLEKYFDPIFGKSGDKLR